jgi:hypothetical protein
MADFTFDERVVQRGRRLGHGDDEAQIEQKLERGRRPVRFFSISGDHRSATEQGA